MRLWIGAMLAFLTAACSPLSMFNAVIPKDPQAGRVLTDVAYGEGPRRKLDVYPGAGAAGAKPVIVFVYGGSWASGRRQDYRWVGRALAAQGFVTVVPDYRLVPDNLFPDFLNDVAAAVRWTRDHAAEHGGDPDRIVLVGHSAGAYNVMMVGLDKRFLDRAGVPPSAIRGVVGLSGPYDFYPWDADASRNALGQWPDPLETQPITFVRADAPPLFLLHGSTDTTVKPRNVARLEAPMKAAGGRVQSKIYEGLDHKGTVLALARPFRGNSTVLTDVTTFAREVTQ